MFKTENQLYDIKILRKNYPQSINENIEKILHIQAF